MSKFSVRFDDDIDQQLACIKNAGKSKNERLQYLVRNHQSWMNEIESLREQLRTSQRELSEVQRVVLAKKKADQEYLRIVNNVVSD